MRFDCDWSSDVCSSDLTALSSTGLAQWQAPTGGGIGTVTSIAAGAATSAVQTGTSGLAFSVNPITSTGTIALSTTAVSAGVYGAGGANVGVFTVDTQGR